MTLRRHKSRKAQAADRLSKTAKSAKKVAKGTAAYKVAKRTPLKKVSLIAAGAVATAIVAVKALNSGGGGEPATS